MRLIECVPNISEGRRLDVVNAIADGARSSPGVHVLDVASDASHNRSVITMVAEPRAISAAVMALFERALAAIDLRSHSGEHPRLGAVDVVPLVPLGGVSMVECITRSRQLAAAIGSHFQLPVFLYEEAAIRPARRNLADIRRGEFEGLAAKLRQEQWTPDYGPSTPHPTAGATVIGARMPLIAFNVNLASSDLAMARQIAVAVRQSSGGLPAVKALGVSLADRGIVQVSMNLTNYHQTSITGAFNAVRLEAERQGVAVLESEIVGLVPEEAVEHLDPQVIQLARFSPSQVLEEQLRQMRSRL